MPDHDPASLARVLVIRMERPAPGVEAHLSAAQAGATAGHLAAVGGLWLDWLEGAAGRESLAPLALQFEPLRRAWSAHLKAQQPHTVNAFRIATNLATNSLTWQALSLHPQLGEFFRAYRAEHREGLQQVAGAMAHSTTEALEAARYLSALRELLGSGKMVLLPYGMGISALRSDGNMVLVPRGLSPSGDRLYEDVSRDRILGWAGEDGTVYLLPDLARQAIERVLGGPDALGRISNKALYAQLADLEVIASSNAGRSTKTVKIAGDSLVLLHLKVNAREDEKSEAADENEILL
ncbi:MAG: hypothetical protein EXR62_02535 [Chloroflexi bacterium]|nr:hypothetical protein [Chloroflexota bacterium]